MDPFTWTGHKIGSAAADLRAAGTMTCQKCLTEAYKTGGIAMPGRLDDNALRPKGKVAVLCATPECGWELYLDPLDPRLGTGALCSFCLGEERICCCSSPDGGRPVVAGREPCKYCGRVDEWWDYIKERAVRRETTYAA